MGEVISLDERRKLKGIKTARLVLMAVYLRDKREKHLACMELHQRRVNGESIPHPLDAWSSTEPPPSAS